MSKRSKSRPSYLMIPLTPEEHQIIREGAARAAQPMATWVRTLSLAAAAIMTQHTMPAEELRAIILQCVAEGIKDRAEFDKRFEETRERIRKGIAQTDGQIL